MVCRLDVVSNTAKTLRKMSTGRWKMLVVEGSLQTGMAIRAALLVLPGNMGDAVVDKVSMILLQESNQGCSFEHFFTFTS